jgi:hypothetical protein
MPPSGFGEITRQGLRTSNKANSNDLQNEVASGKYPDFRTALLMEILRIGLALGSYIPEKIIRGLLESAVGFYELIEEELRDAPETSIETVIENALDKFDHIAQSIHLTDDGKLERREN